MGEPDGPRLDPGGALHSAVLQHEVQDLLPHLSDPFFRFGSMSVAES